MPVDILFPIKINYTTEAKVEKKILVPEATKKKIYQHVQGIGVGDYYFIIKKMVNTRSGRQNRYFHGYLLEEIRKKKGFLFIDQAKDLIKELFLEIKFEKVKAREDSYDYVYIPSKYFTLDESIINDAKIAFTAGHRMFFPTSELKTSGQELLNADVRMWASLELGLYLKLPNETD
jgi:hypothetical protein